ncbi:MAG TPA: TIM-barrel domain-containing protein [Sphingobacterium sp.]|nr:TIM-barrel domain-containing protein [Sphingobacterium sp.]
MKLKYKKKVIMLMSTVFFLMNIQAQTLNKIPGGINCEINGITTQITFYNPGMVRVRKAPAGWKHDKESLAVIATPEKVKFRIKQNNKEIRLATEQIVVKINLSSGQVSFIDPDGNSLLHEKVDGAAFFDFTDVDTKTFRVKQAYTLDEEEAIYGLGILQNGKMSQRNQKKYMLQSNSEDFVPFIQSIKGYGVYWDNNSPTTFFDDKNETSFESEVGDCIDYYFMYGGNADGVIAQMRHLTGDVPMFPLWTYGFWQSRERYKSQRELLEVVSKHRELGVPLDGIIQDWQYWGSNYLWNAMDFLNEEFSRPQEMVDEVHKHHAHLIISIWSSFGPRTKQYEELNDKGLLLNFTTWPESGSSLWPPRQDYPSGVKPYDPYSPVAREIYWKYLNGLFDYGMDGWWMDSTEPDHVHFKDEDLNISTSMGSFRRNRNAYPLLTVGGVYENQRKTTDSKRVFILTRSGFAGQQRYGANVWSGDIGSSWETLRKQITAGLNFTLTGNPNFNSDIGGFFCGAYNKGGDATKNPLFQELYVRWMQQGAFTPMMRSHGTDIKREIYYFGKKGEPIYDAIESAIHLRYSLLPYIYSTSWDVTKNQSSFMRALVMDFPEDKNVWDMHDQYMFGKSILVAPIVKAQYTPEKIVEVDELSGWDKHVTTDADGNVKANFTQPKSTQVYLPAGAVWYDYWTNEAHKGGQEITRKSTIDLVPMFIKAGSILPIGPKVQYATEKAWDNLEIKVYTGANGMFTLYEDEFDNYNYEQGAYTEIPMKWDNASRKLSIGKRVGSYNGMLTNRKFTITLQDGSSKTVSYDGNALSIKF